MGFHDLRPGGQQRGDSRRDTALAPDLEPGRHEATLDIPECTVKGLSGHEKDISSWPKYCLTREGNDW